MNSLDRDRSGWVARPAALSNEAMVAVRAAAVAAGGGHLTVWVTDPTPTTDAVAAAHGLDVGRDLLQLRIALPVGGPRSPITLRAFQPGHDEAAWLAVNNRAFAWHPEQGGWELEDVVRREREPWFDPAGFLLHETEGRLAGFCWTKVHPSPLVGEIYVIAVDPDFAGRGLGRQLTLAGLDHLAGHGIADGMLYVDAANTAARALYAAMGFELDHVDRSYVVQLPDTPTSAPIP